MEAVAATERREAPGLVGLLDFCKGVAIASCWLLSRLDSSELPKRIFRTGAAGPASPPNLDEAAGAVVRQV